MPTPTVIAGTDFGKSEPEAHAEPSGATRLWSNDERGRRALRSGLLYQGVARVVFEPTGRYHRDLHPASGGTTAHCSMSIPQSAAAPPAPT